MVILRFPMIVPINELNHEFPPGGCKKINPLFTSALPEMQMSKSSLCGIKMQYVTIKYIIKSVNQAEIAGRVNNIEGRFELII